MGHQASRRVIAVGMTPAFLNASASAARSGLSRPPNSSGVDAGRDEQAIKPEVARSLQIGANRITDCEHAIAADLRTAHGLRHGERLFVDRSVRFAGVEHLSAERCINVSQCARAVNELLAALHHKVRIGAQHEHIACSHGTQQLAVIVRCFGVVVEEAGADREVGAIGRRKLQVQSLENRQVALGAEMINSALPLRDDVPRHVAGGHDGIIAAARQPELIKVVPNNRTWTRRVGNQDDRTSSLAEAYECVGRLWKGNDAIVYDAPDVAQKHIVAVSQQLEMVGK